MASSAAATASETTTYSYDALGRLVAVATTGGPNGGTTVSTGYDPAGNRASYGVSGAGAAGWAGAEPAAAAEPAPSVLSEEPAPAEEAAPAGPAPAGPATDAPAAQQPEEPDR